MKQNSSQANTLNDMFYRTMEYKKLKLKESSVHRYFKTWKRYIYNSIGQHEISDIKPSDLKMYYATQFQKGYSTSTVQLTHSLINMVLENACEDNLLPRNPDKCAFASMRIKTNTTEKIPLTEHQITNLIEFCSHGVYSAHMPFLTIALNTGMRVGELTGLCWQNIDMAERIITVDHQLIYENFGEGFRFYITSPKTHSSRRRIPMNTACHKAFLELEKIRHLPKRQCKTNIDGYNDFCFLTAKGKPYTTASLDLILYRIRAAYNKQHPDTPLPHLSCHILRHTAATIFADNGFALKSLQNLLGHSKLDITMNCYVHTNISKIQEEMAKLEKVYLFDYPETGKGDGGNSGHNDNNGNNVDTSYD